VARPLRHVLPAADPVPVAWNPDRVILPEEGLRQAVVVRVARRSVGHQLKGAPHGPKRGGVDDRGQGPLLFDLAGAAEAQLLPDERARVPLQLDAGGSLVGVRVVWRGCSPY
jgi:hypothetical protein